MCNSFINDNEEIKINNKADEVIEKLFESLLSRYQNNVETSMRGSDFIFDCVYLLFMNVIKQIQTVVDRI